MADEAIHGTLGEPEAARRAMASLERAIGGFEGPLHTRLLSGGRSNPTYELTDGSRAWVLRRPPRGRVLPSTHDMGREVRVLRALEASPVPVPRVVHFEDDAAVLGVPFYVMEKLEGRTLATAADTGQLSREERRELALGMVDTLVTLHGIEPDEVGLQGFGNPAGYLERQLIRWEKQWSAVATDEMRDVGTLLERLGSTIPVTARTGIVHGDFKLDNIMVQADSPSEIRAVLDWEMAALGDCAADLGVLISFWDDADHDFNPITAGATALPGFPSRLEMIDAYAERSGSVLADIDWYIMLADFKVAVLLQGIHSRRLRGEAAGSRTDDVGQMVAPLIARALSSSR